MPENVYRERPLLAKPFQIGWEGADELGITISEDFGERVWGAWFGELQQALETCRWENRPIRMIHVNFSSCRWADPLPLLSLSLALADFESNGKAVRLTFPSGCAKTAQEVNEEAEDCRNCTRFLKFLAREGFFELLVRRQPAVSPASLPAIKPPLRNVTLGDSILEEGDLTRLGEVWTPLVFEESTCLPARLLNMRHPSDAEKQAHIDDDDIDRWVERVLDAQITPVVADKVPAWAQRGLKYRLQLLLRETLHNVAQHAYRDRGLVAVYVRYRQGLLGQAPSTRTLLEKLVQREENNQHMALLGSPRRYLGFIRTRTGFFEFYVLDAGRGFVDRITEDKDMKHLLKDANPFHKAMLAVFQDGYSSKSDRPTAKGGLHLLQQILEPNQDYIRGRDEDTWWGVTLPLPSSQSDTTPEGQFTIDCEASRSKVKPIRGFALMARLSWLNPMDQMPAGAWLGMEEEGHRKPLIEILKSGNGDTDVLEGVAVHDWRLSGRPWSNVGEFAETSASSLMVLPTVNWMKNSIQDRLSELLSSGCLAPDGTLWLGEIASHEVMPYLAAIRNARRLFIGLAQRPQYIVMVTRTLRACVLERGADGIYLERRSLARAFVENQQIPRLSTFKWRLADYYRLLRMHDGRRLWEAVGALPPRLLRGKVNDQPTQAGSAQGLATPFLNEWVDWHGLWLDGYLDFPETLTHPICRELYGLNLHRLTALFPNYECRFVPLDSLVESLIIRFRAEQRPPRPSKQPILKVRIGSVQVTGLTERLNTGTDTLFHFLRHPSGNAGGRYLLPWLAAPSQNNKPNLYTDANERGRGFYERIGRTPAIGRDGWKAFHLPHFDRDEHPVYEEPPSRSYRTWQDASRSPMKIGHWSYGGHHDLLTINLLLAFDTELDQISIALAGTLGRFIYANLFRVLDLQPEHLNALGKSLHGAIKHDNFRNLLPASIGQNGGLLLFPSHPVTDHVLARLMTWVEDDTKRNEVLARCIPVLPIRRHRGGSGLQLSGLTLERLRSFVPGRDDGTGSPPPIVFFDDAMVTGRTFIELKSLLHDVGFQDIYSLTMLDRQRLPASHHVNQQILQSAGVRDACFWRLDAPALGSPGHCPLCRGLMRVKELAERLTGRELRARADQWQELWSERNPATEWGDGGLRPIPVELRKNIRKFGIVPRKDSPSGYRQAGGDEHQIQLTNSAGLAAWVTELHSVTARDDLVVRLVEREDRLSPEVKIQLVASQLLLFFGEFDADFAVEMGLHLISALREATEHDRNTSLAAVTLMACGDRFLAQVIRRLVANSGSDDPAKVTQQVRQANQDFWLVLEFCQLLNIDFGPWAPPRYSTSVEQVTGAPSSAVQDRRDLYRRFYLIVQISDSHSSDLRRLASLPDASDREKISAYFRRAKDCAVDLKSLVSRLDQVWLRGDEREGIHVKDQFTERRAHINELADQLIKAIKSALQDNKEDVSFQSAKDLAGSLLREATDLFHALFMPVGIARMKEGSASTLLAELQDTAKVAQKNDKIITCVETSGYYNECAVLELKKAQMDEAYIVWDSDLRYALDEILSNVKHTEGPMTCPKDWHHKHVQATADQWMHLKIEEQHLVLNLRQRDSGEQLASKVEQKMKGKGCWKAFTQIGGSVTFESVEGYLQTSIRIPYAHTL